MLPVRFVIMSFVNAISFPTSQRKLLSEAIPATIASRRNIWRNN